MPYFTPPETAISAVNWPNDWGDGAHGINAACIQLGVKTLASLGAMMEDPERWLCCAEQVFELMYCRSANC